MGTIAARDALRIIELTETILAIVQLALCQAFDLRGGKGCHHRSRELHEAIRRIVPTNNADRRQYVDIQSLLELYRARELPIGSIDFPAE
jgi:histidine ammonia-lyase